jgi:N-dimethylarginine dimethylaminohydrolase
MSIVIGSNKIFNKKYCSHLYLQKQINAEIENLNSTLKTIFKLLKINVSELLLQNNKICNSIWVRDIFFRLNNELIVTKPARKSTLGQNRYFEYKSIIKLLDVLNKKYFLITDDSIKVEGGDIIQNEEFIFIGFGERTNKKGIKFVKSINKSNKKTFVIQHSALHLDCCFTLLKNNTLIYTSKYIKNLPFEICKKFNCIRLEDILPGVEETNLALNFLIVNNNIIISKKKQFSSLRTVLRKLGYKLILVDFNNDILLGGSIRCFTQWIDLPKNTNIF